MKKIIITYGIIAGFITGGLMLATMPLFVNGTINHDNGLWIGYTGMVIALSLVFFGVKSFRDNHAGGTITFGKAFIIGISITMIASVFYVIAWEITYARSGDWFMEQWSNGEIVKLRESGASDADILKAKEEWEGFVEIYKNPMVRFGMTLMEIFPVGLLISLISAALLRKNEFLPSNSH
jgi:hypothetical protein